MLKLEDKEFVFDYFEPESKFTLKINDITLVFGWWMLKDIKKYKEENV